MRFRSIVTFAAAALMGACGKNPVYGNATFAVRLDTVKVSALNGTPIGSLSGLEVTYHTVSRAQTDSIGLVPFDLALDLDGTGKVVLYPARLIATDVRGAGQRVIGLQTSTRSFEDMREAPGSGYKYDSLLVVSPGQTVVFDSRTGICQGAFLPSVYGKLVVDSVGANRTIYLRIASSPNCGFRQLVPGEVPKR